jgi:hypothetical protein
MVSLSCYLDSVAASAFVASFIFKNGSQYCIASDGYALAGCGGMLVSLTAGEYIDIRLYNGDSSTRSINTSDNSWLVSVYSI